jgi:hypothetical protein
MKKINDSGHSDVDSALNKNLDKVRQGPMEPYK